MPDTPAMTAIPTVPIEEEEDDALESCESADVVPTQVYRPPPRSTQLNPSAQGSTAHASTLGVYCGDECDGTESTKKRVSMGHTADQASTRTDGARGGGGEVLLGGGTALYRALTLGVALGCRRMRGGDRGCAARDLARALSVPTCCRPG
jgi:hypothetical protein